MLACLTLAVTCDGAEVTTAAGLAADDGLHPVQQAFLDHDGFQCGYCTPGQVCSAVGMLDEFAPGWPSHVTPTVAATPELDRRGDRRADERQPVPLRGLRRHRGRDQAGGGEPR